MEIKDLQGVLKERMIPEAQVFELTGTGVFSLCDGADICLEAPGEARREAVRLLGKYWNIDAKITAGECTLPLGAEGYQIDCDASRLTIRAATADGMRHALRSCRMLVEPERGRARLSGTWLLPEVHIEDAPALAFRGLHLCVFPENRFTDIAKKIRFAAYLKFNYVVVEFWGTFPYESHPELCWAEFAGSREEWSELIAEMRGEGVTLIPQLNLLGHAPGSRGGTGQHVVLNRHPELAPLFEPDDWCWCLTNPETRKFLAEAVCELHDFFGRPPFFHIGCDEADTVGTCVECRKHPVAELIRRHICYFHDLLAARGARIIMWHDMLLNQNDPRWAHYVACGRPYQKLDELYKVLPKDIVIADWQYGYNFAKLAEPPQYPTSKFFKANGFDVLPCPWRDLNVVTAIGKMAREEKFMGMLETTWHIFYGPEMQRMFYTAAQSAWGIAHRAEYGGQNVQRAWRDIVRDMGLEDYNDLGFSDFQVIPKTYGSLG